MCMYVHSSTRIITNVTFKIMKLTVALIDITNMAIIEETEMVFLTSKQFMG